MLTFKASRLFIKFTLVMISFFLSVIQSFANSREHFELALRRALDSSATWTMEKTIEGTPIRISSSGIVKCFKGQGIFWQMQKPFVSGISMKGKEMRFFGEDGERVVPSSEMPHYEEITKAIDEFASGKDVRFEKLFKIEASNLSTNQWRVRLEPKRRDMRQLIKFLELTGSATLNEVVFYFSSGEKAHYTFKEVFASLPAKGSK
ncbi:MAG: hypothetical protein J6S51_04680 [Kiritimatiellae bacterium]|nr:hypothetical protein [Kiritimatiellia bacterium]